VIVVTSIAVVLTSVPLMKMVGKTFLPQDDQSEFEIGIRSPGGFTLAETSRTMAEIENRLWGLRGVTTVMSSIGDQTGRVRAGEGDVTSGSIYVKLVDLRERKYSQFDVMDDARKILAEYPDLRTSVHGINPLSSGGSRIAELELNLRGPDLEQLQGYAGKLIDGMRTLQGVVDVDTTLAVRTPELRLIIDREKASDQGINVRDIAGTVQTFIAGEPVSKFKEADQQYDIWLRAAPGHRRTPTDIADLTVQSRDGQLVRLGNLVRLSEDLGPAQVDRIDRQRSITIMGDLLPGRALGDAVTHTEKVAKDLDMPPLYNIQWAGRAKGMAESSQNFLLAFALSFLFMYMVLAAQFESFLHPITILLALPLVVPCALLSLVLTGEALNIYSTLGLFMLLGVVKKNGILQVDYTNTLRANGRAARRGDPAREPRAPPPDPHDDRHARPRHDPDRARAGAGCGVARVDRAGDRRRAAPLAPHHAADHPGRVLALRRPGEHARLRPPPRARAGLASSRRAGDTQIRGLTSNGRAGGRDVRHLCGPGRRRDDHDRRRQGERHGGAVLQGAERGARPRGARSADRGGDRGPPRARSRRGSI
jgi:HAE1 family hydrophobic/amphiphilic exporter-1